MKPPARRTYEQRWKALRKWLRKERAEWSAFGDDEWSRGVSRAFQDVLSETTRLSRPLPRKETRR